MRRQGEVEVIVSNDIPAPSDIAREVLTGLRRPQKMLPARLFYDELGSTLFEEITRLDEYYLTRTESAIMERYGGEMAGCIDGSLLVEYGSGSSTKTRLLLANAHNLAGYVPVDISCSHLVQSAREIAQAFPYLAIYPICSDYTGSLDLSHIPDAPTVTAYFPGSTIGNFVPEEAVQFMSEVARMCAPTGGMLIGVDLRKDPPILEAAYNDARGVTAAFNKNILRHLNGLLGAGFDPDTFEHVAFFNAREGRIEMHLRSLSDQQVVVAGETLALYRGESICTEYSYKYEVPQFTALAERSGFLVERLWTDPRNYFAIFFLRVAGN